MSSQAPAHEDAHEAHHGHSHGHQACHCTFRSYMTGFALSVILTAIPFCLVMSGVFESPAVTMMRVKISAMIVQPPSLLVFICR
ncbi:cytochrome o ubiquinol oxidase subunit IV, partial [Rhizobium ruizarguesonis]